ncbi:MAG: HesA/MoeB/ThiF family protein [Candidatus Binataceae bacterium]|nr:HesA/MoeB/ThiF family protein [Candidatus Binataceae bacterium]
MSADNHNSRILIAGLGGLGVPAATVLIRAGFDRLTLIDPDTVELSNLPRQVLFGASDIGAPKVIAAARRLGELRSGAPPIAEVAIEAHVARLDHSNAAELIGAAAFVIDATDDPVTKFLINDVCVALRRPFVYGGVLGLAGQAMTVIPGVTACLRCLFEEPPGPDDAANCREAGIIGPIAGAIGAAQASEAMRMLGGRMPALAGTILTLDDSLTGRIRLTHIAPRAGCGCGAASINDEAGAIAPAAR